MNKLLISLFVFIGLACMNFAPVQAGAPTCHTHSSGPYCQYTGKVDKAYINSGNGILIYFDTPIPDVGIASSQGFSIANSGRYAGIFRLTESNKLFGNGLYATALTALAGDKTITVQMRGVEAGYLKIDRIWINKD